MNAAGAAPFWIHSSKQEVAVFAAIPSKVKVVIAITVVAVAHKAVSAFVLESGVHDGTAGLELSEDIVFPLAVGVIASI